MMYKWSYWDKFDGLSLEDSWVFDQGAALWPVQPLQMSTTKNLFAPSGPLFAIINGTAGDDNLVAFIDFNDGDTVSALAGNDTIDATGIDNLTVFGGSGDDVVTVQPNLGLIAYVLDGGDGIDHLVFDTALLDDGFNNFGGTFSLTTNTATGDYAGMSAVNFEALTMTGGGLSDHITGGSGDDIINDGGGFFSPTDNTTYYSNDTLIGLGGNDILTANGGNNLLDGGDGDDILNGSFGNDRLLGGAGDDELFGGDGFDDLEGGAGADVLDGGAGFDRAVYRGAADAITVDLGNVANNTGEAAGDTYISIEMVLGSHFDDIIRGNDDGQRLSGQGGDDVLIGYGGNDILYGDGNDDLSLDGDDWLAGGEGDDTLFGQGGNDSLFGGEGDDMLFGQAGDDLLSGGGGNDILYGDGNDDLSLDGDDRLDGGQGDDTLFGQGGSNTFVFKYHAGNDRIMDFKDGIDTIEFGGAAASISDLTITQDGADVLIASGNGVVRVLNFLVADIDNADFVFSGSSIVGTEGDDVLSSPTDFGSDDVVYALAGDDIISVGVNHVRVFGGTGNDTINAQGIYRSFIFAESGDDVVTVRPNNIGVEEPFRGFTLNGGDGIDCFIFDTSALIDGYNLFGGTFNLTTNTATGAYTGVSAVNFEALTMTGGGWADHITGGSGDDIIFDGGGINSNLPPDQRYADDTLVGLGGNDILTVLGGNNLLDGGDGDDVLNGSFGNDRLLGGAGEDMLFGGDGLDDLEGGAGADVLDGGDGFDRAVYRGAAGAVTVDLSNVANNKGDAAGDTYISIEMVLGSHFDDSITGNDDGQRLSGQGGDDLLIGLGGNDLLYGDGNDDLSLDGDDRLEGGEGDDTLYGQGGSNTFVFEANAGNDRIMDFDNGVDTIEYIDGPANFGDLTITQDGADVLIESSHGIVRVLNTVTADFDASDFVFIVPIFVDLTNGNDLYVGSALNETVNGLDGNDTIYGNDGDDVLNGDGGNDTLFGGGGADVLNGGAGVDRVFYSTSNTAVTVNMINTALNTGADAVGDTFISIENISGSQFNDYLTGNSSNNDLIGLGGNDILVGANGNDRLFGGNGNDRLLGGRGNDTMFGQGGADTYIIRANAGNDRIYGFDDGLDIVEYRNGPASFTDLTITQVGADTRIDSVNGTLTLKAFTAADLSAADFTFISPAAAEAPTIPKGSAAQESSGEASEVLSLSSEANQDLIAEFLAQGFGEQAPIVYTDAFGVLSISPDWASDSGHDFFESMSLL